MNIGYFNGDLGYRGKTNKALLVADELLSWCQCHFSGGSTPEPGVMITYGSLTVQIGEVIVWNSEKNDDDELTSSSCIERYVREIRDMTPVEAEVEP